VQKLCSVSFNKKTVGLLAKNGKKIKAEKIVL
jgi:hypothetical protein